MKKVFGVLIVLAFQSMAFSQDIDARLTKKYSKEELKQMVNEKPEQYKMLVYALDHACYIADAPKGKDSELTQSITLDPNSKFTFLDLGLDIQKVNQYIKISGTDKMLVVKSEWVLNNELNTRK